MDSGNSGSVQTSSTGGGSRGGREDQEFESRALLNPTSLAVFDNTAASSQLYSLNDGTSFSAYHHQVSNYKFDPPTFSQSMMINHTNNSNIVGNDRSGGDIINNSLGMVWPKNYSSIQSSLDDANNCTNSSVTNQQFNTCATYSHQLQRPPLPIPSSMDSARLAKSSPGSLNQQGSGGGGRLNPKKRSRASRRTPTTVLTTDTNNFRQMVQEFTGIPASPFETAFTGRPRLDLFGIQLPRDNSSSMLDVSSSTMEHPHLMRPFPQKIVSPYPINVPNITTSNSQNIIATRINYPIHVSGFGQGDRPTMSLGSKATDSLMNEFALGHNTSTTNTRSALGRHQVKSVDEGGGNNNVITSANLGAPLENHKG